ncbi:MAG: amidohydrolase family protein [Acidimicrobiia bacterium]
MAVAPDVLLRGASVVDGTGAPARAADVAIDGGRITAVAPPGELRPGARTEVVELDGLTLAPGFVDIHTHYDAQVLWDPDLTPSSWHGVTSVVMGNCGFAVAPTRPEHRELIIRMFENVEGMSADALEAGIDWCFESFPEYLDALEQRPVRLNIGAFVGHSTLRLFAMGPEEREATPGEIETMCALLRDALRAGAIGLSTSRAAQHQGAFGRPVPSRFASLEEVHALAAVLGDRGDAVMEIAAGPGLWLEEYAEIATEFGIPVTWTALLTRSDRPGAALRAVERGAALGGEVYPQMACRPIVAQITLLDPTLLGEIDEWKEALARPREERAALYRDPEWRDRARGPTLAAWSRRWQRITVDETETSADAVGMPLDALADQRGTTPFDLMLDLALGDGLATRFRVVMDNDSEAEIAQLLADKRTLLGLSDAGAHATQLCDACYSSFLLSHWVREQQALTMEDAVWRLSGHPCQALGIPDRGLVRVGHKADLVAFEPDTVGIGPVTRVHDQPGGTDRVVVDSVGIEHVWVNGTAIRRDGHDLPDARPGQLLRPG